MQKKDPIGNKQPTHRMEISVGLLFIRYEMFLFCGKITDIEGFSYQSGEKKEQRLCCCFRKEMWEGGV